MRKKLLLGVVAGVLCIPISLCAALLAKNQREKIISVQADPHSLTLNSTLFGMSGLTNEYQTSVTQDFNIEGYPVMEYFLAKKDAGSNLVLAPAGKIFNYSNTATYGGRITDIISVNITYTGGKLFLQEGFGGGSRIYGDKVEVVSGETLTLASRPNYVMISNSLAETTVTSLQVSFSCSDPGYSVERLGKKYNGVAENGAIYTLTRDGSNIQFGDYPGTVSVASNTGEFTMTLAGGALVLNGTISANYKTLTFTGKSGAYADAVPAIMNLNQVYVMDDFESYQATGTTFTGNASHAKAQSEAYVTSATASDLRAAYYADYGSGDNNTWIESSDFGIPTSTDFINLTSAIKHSGNQSMAIKGSTGGWMRYWSSEIFNQKQHYTFGSGNRFSFWVHAPIKADGSNQPYDGAKTPKIRAQVYYKNFVITHSNRNSESNGTGTFDFEVSKNGEWQQKVITLDPSKEVYAVNFMVDNGTVSSNVYLPIDDIEISTYSPFKAFNQTATRITKTYNADVTALGKSSKIKLGLGANGRGTGWGAIADMKVSGYKITGNSITINTTGEADVLGVKYTFGDWTGTLSNDNNTITVAKSDITGTVKNLISTDPIVLNLDSIGATGEEDLATLASKFNVQVNNGGWKAIEGDDAVTFTPDYYIEGSHAIKIKNSTSYWTRMIVKPEVATTLGKIESVAFWYYAPANVKYNIRVYAYSTATPVDADDANPGRVVQADVVTYGNSDAGWRYLNVGLNTVKTFEEEDVAYNKNFAISIMNSRGQNIIDYVTFH